MPTYDRIQAAFPGGPQPAVVVVQAADVNPAKTLPSLHIALQRTGTDDASNAALATLREDVIRVGSRVLWRSQARVPGRARRGPARLPIARRRHLLAAAVLFVILVGRS